MRGLDCSATTIERPRQPAAWICPETEIGRGYDGVGLPVLSWCCEMVGSRLKEWSNGVARREENEEKAPKDNITEDPRTNLSSSPSSNEVIITHHRRNYIIPGFD